MTGKMKPNWLQLQLIWSIVTRLSVSDKELQAERFIIKIQYGYWTPHLKQLSLLIEPLDHL